MATVSPATLTFYKGASLGPPYQVRAVTIAGENVYVTVDEPPPGGNFSWNGSPPGGWLLNPPPPPPPAGSSSASSFPVYKPPAMVPVTFKPPSMAPVQATMRVNIQRNDATRSAIPGFPMDVVLEGNADGVGPGRLNISHVEYNPPGPDLDAEFVEITNISDTPVDLRDCRVGDMRPRRGPRQLYWFDSSFTLDPVSNSSGQKYLRIYTGSGPGAPASADVVQIALNRGAPVWGNIEDRAWITNPFGQLVDEYVYSTGRNLPTTTPMPPNVTVVPVPPGGSLVPTSISVEEGDRLMFSAFGEIWVGYGLSGGRSDPDGKGPEPAGIGWPAPDAPPISLIGTIGSTGRYFVVGTSLNLTVDDAEGPLFLGVNDINLGDNWGAGYTCTVTHVRP